MDLELVSKSRFENKIRSIGEKQRSGAFSEHVFNWCWSGTFYWSLFFYDTLSSRGKVNQVVAESGEMTMNSYQFSSTPTSCLIIGF